jgi:hypothetical protein
VFFRFNFPRQKTPSLGEYRKKRAKKQISGPSARELYAGLMVIFTHSSGGSDGFWVESIGFRNCLKNPRQFFDYFYKNHFLIKKTHGIACALGYGRKTCLFRFFRQSGRFPEKCITRKTNLIRRNSNE